MVGWDGSVDYPRASASCRRLAHALEDFTRASGSAAEAARALGITMTPVVVAGRGSGLTERPIRRAALPPVCWAADPVIWALALAALVGVALALS